MFKRSSIGEIINKAFELYKANFQLFILISLAASLFSVFFSTISSIVNLEDAFNAIFVIVGTLVAVYFSIRLQIALIIAINNRNNGFDTTIKECYVTAGSYFWSYFLTSLGLVLIIALPAVFAIVPFSMETSIWFMAIAGLVFGATALLLIFYFNFAPLVSVLNPEATSNFQFSRQLVKGNTILVIKMIAIGLVAQFVIYFFQDLFTSEISFTGQIVSALVDLIIGSLIAPLFSAVYILVYQELLQNKENKSTAV